jgi:hypothetical protein
MRYSKFTWGPMAQGLYTAMLWFTLFIAWKYPAHLTAYVLLLIFLGFGLRPLLEVTGLYDAFSLVGEKLEQARWATFEKKRRAEVQRRERDKRYRHRRIRDERLPRNW